MLVLLDVPSAICLLLIVFSDLSALTRRLFAGPSLSYHIARRPSPQVGGGTAAGRPAKPRGRDRGAKETETEPAERGWCGERERERETERESERESERKRERGAFGTSDGDGVTARVAARVEFGVSADVELQGAQVATQRGYNGVGLPEDKDSPRSERVPGNRVKDERCSEDFFAKDRDVSKAINLRRAAKRAYVEHRT